tara:strand:+ start:96 stop:422 length:327 start_codon:yes stop_codon:yes gene_type:complete
MKRKERQVVRAGRMFKELERFEHQCDKSLRKDYVDYCTESETDSEKPMPYNMFTAFCFMTMLHGLYEESLGFIRAYGLADKFKEEMLIEPNSSIENMLNDAGLKTERK